MVRAAHNPLRHRRPRQVGDRQHPQPHDVTLPTSFARFLVQVPERLLHLRPVLASELLWIRQEQRPVGTLGTRHQTPSGTEDPRLPSSFLARAVSTRPANLSASAPATRLPKSVIL